MNNQTEKDPAGSVQRMVRPFGLHLAREWWQSCLVKSAWSGRRIRLEARIFCLKCGQIFRLLFIRLQLFAHGIEDGPLLSNGRTIKEELVQCLKSFNNVHNVSNRPNDPSSATRPTRAFDCNLDAMAGFAAAHG